MHSPTPTPGSKIFFAIHAKTFNFSEKRLTKMCSPLNFHYLNALWLNLVFLERFLGFYTERTRLLGDHKHWFLPDFLIK